MGLHVVFAPHLDDEVIGCFSVWSKINIVVYFTKDYREEIVLEKIKAMKEAGAKVPTYSHIDDFKVEHLRKLDTIYLPSRFDFHPLHREVRNKYLLLPCKKMFYSIDMNTPWNEEEEKPEAKLALLQHLYPGEDLFEKNAKYYLFNSVKPYDEIFYYVFDLTVGTDKVIIKIQEFEEDVDFRKDFMSLINSIKNTSSNLIIFRTLQHHYPNRKVKLESHLWGGTKHTIE